MRTLEELSAVIADQYRGKLSDLNLGDVAEILAEAIREGSDWCDFCPDRDPHAWPRMREMLAEFVRAKYLVMHSLQIREKHKAAYTQASMAILNELAETAMAVAQRCAEEALEQARANLTTDDLFLDDYAHRVEDNKREIRS